MYLLVCVVKVGGVSLQSFLEASAGREPHSPNSPNTPQQDDNKFENNLQTFRAHFGPRDIMGYSARSTTIPFGHLLKVSLDTYSLIIEIHIYIHVTE